MGSKWYCTRTAHEQRSRSEKRETTHFSRKVIENKLWRQITSELGVDPERTDAGFRLRIHYLRYLYPYERKFFLGLEDDGVSYDEMFEPRTVPKGECSLQLARVLAPARLTAKQIVKMEEPRSRTRDPTSLWNARRSYV